MIPLDELARLFDREKEWFIVRTLEFRDVVRRERVGKTFVIVAGPALRALLSGEQEDEHGGE